MARLSWGRSKRSDEFIHGPYFAKYDCFRGNVHKPRKFVRKRQKTQNKYVCSECHFSNFWESPFEQYPHIIEVTVS